MSECGSTQLQTHSMTAVCSTLAHTHALMQDWGVRLGQLRVIDVCHMALPLHFFAADMCETLSLHNLMCS